MDPSAVLAAQQEDLADAQEKQLPEGVVFATAEVQMDERSLLLQQDMQSNQNGMASMGGELMGTGQEYPPVLFYPDGTTSDAKVVLTNEYQKLYVVVSLRGLTGLARMSDLVSADEIQLVP